MKRWKHWSSLLLVFALFFGMLPQARAVSQVYYSIDYRTAAVNSRITQKISGDCAVVSVATIEAMMHGATSSSEKTAVYNAVVNKNLGTTSNQPNAKAIQRWSALGYQTLGSFSLQKLYDQLAQGYPVIVHRTNGTYQHWSVVCAYVGSTTSLQESGFIVMDVGTAYNSSTCKMNLTQWKNVHSGSKLDNIAYRKNGIPISLSGIRFAINFPEIVHPKGSGHGVYGYVTSNNNLSNVTVQVINAQTGAYVFNKTLTPNAKSYNLYNLDSSMTFASWAAGKYYYLITAKDTSGAGKAFCRYFTIAASWPSSRPEEPVFTFSYDANGGSGNISSQSVNFVGTIKLPADTCTRSGYTFKGWHVKRLKDNKWYTTSGTWSTDAQISSNGYAKWIYAAGSSYGMGREWIKDCTDISNYTFYAVWEKNVTSVSDIFTDVPANAWYIAYVQYVYDNGIMQGITPTTFAPNASLTRAQMVQILYSRAGSPKITGSCPFTDVPAGAWYYNAVNWAYQKGIVSGTSATTFSPGNKVTREALAMMLYCDAGKPAVSADMSRFADSDQISSWALGAMNWAVRSGLLNGSVSGGKIYLRPKGTATRAEAATIITQYSL
ncbi:S-layer homology domain-containing protein [Butyricicoccus sp.]|uniref:S-layer homology domain-containing protein n=1 Tax=Butyricicoccus sp. TaxID=2049021 RepID=UPI003F15C3E0